MSRLFFALYPNNGVRNRLTSLSERISGGQRINSNNFHLTLHFIGHTNTQDCLIERAEQILCNPFGLNIDRYGYFNQAQVLWAGPKQYPENLPELARNCAKASAACGYNDEGGHFTPHISLIRKAKNKPELQGFEPFKWTLNSFSLMLSESDPKGTHYRVLREFPMHL